MIFCEFLKALGRINVHLDYPLNTIEAIDNKLMINETCLTFAWPVSIYSQNPTLIRLTYESEDTMHFVPNFKHKAKYINKIECNACSSTLLSSKLEWKDLPGEGWRDMVDCWSCHDNEFLTAKTFQIMLPLPGIGFVGDDYLIMNEADLVSGHCDCGELIATREEQHHWRIQKFRLKGFALDTILCERIWHLIHYEASYNFLFGNSVWICVVSWKNAYMICDDHVSKSVNPRNGIKLKWSIEKPNDNRVYEHVTCSYIPQLLITLRKYKFIEQNIAYIPFEC